VRRQEQRLLRREQAEQVRLADAGVAGDGLGARALEAAGGEAVGRRLQHDAATLVRTHPGHDSEVSGCSLTSQRPAPPDATRPARGDPGRAAFCAETAGLALQAAREQATDE